MTPEQNHKDYVSLRDYFEAKLAGLEKATIVASTALEKRLEGMNEFRAQIKDQTANFVSRKELEAKIETMEKSKRDNIAIILALVGIVIAILSIIYK